MTDLIAEARAAMAASRVTDDPDYPLYHLAPPVGRLNDPNGLLVLDGTHHAFFQFSPFYPRKLVYWGYATSGDGMTWQHHGPAIAPDADYDRNGAYSGTALVQDGTTSLYYTGNVRLPEGGREAHQCLVTTDDFVTFTKHPDNPLIPEPPAGYTGHVRDPQVWRDADGSLRMLLGAQRSDLTGAALFYRSDDGLAWHFEGEMTFPGQEERYAALGYMWECPAVVRVPDEACGTRDVLVFCPQGMEATGEGFANIFPSCAVVGRLDGTAFHAASDIHAIDHGFEFYAPQVFARREGDDGPPLLVGWLGNASEDDQPSLAHGWVHTFTLLRELRVRDGRLVQIPHVDLSRAVLVPDGLPSRLQDAATPVVGLAGSRSFRLRLALDPEPGAAWALRIGSDASHVDLTVRDGRLTLDRSTSRYPHGDRRTVTLSGVTASSPTVEVFHDRSTTEVFVGDGALTLSLRSYLAPDAAGATLRTEGAMGVRAVEAYRFD
jgi:beta-fructofuranosidase